MPVERKPIDRTAAGRAQIGVAANEIRRLHTQVVSALKEVGGKEQDRLADRLAERLARPAAPRPELRARALWSVRRAVEAGPCGRPSGPAALARRIVLGLLAEQGLELSDDRLYRILTGGRVPRHPAKVARAPSVE